VFQIDLSKNPGVTAQQAGDIQWAANWAGSYLANSLQVLDADFPNLSTPAFFEAIADSYNHGLSGEIRDLNRGLAPDAHTTGHNYGSNVIQLMDCFH
jgi:hypothetical protein